MQENTLFKFLRTLPSNQYTEEITFLSTVVPKFISILGYDKSQLFFDVALSAGSSVFHVDACVAADRTSRPWLIIETKLNRKEKGIPSDWLNQIGEYVSAALADKIILLSPEVLIIFQQKTPRHSSVGNCWLSLLEVEQAIEIQADLAPPNQLSVEPPSFYSCFISYSSNDHALAERLHVDLQSNGVRSWFAPKDMKIGDKLRSRIDESIYQYDRLLLLLSETSIRSQWVEQEVESALAREREQGRTILFPIRLDDAIIKIRRGWPALIKNTRHIGDFTCWKDYDVYQKALARLIRDLKAEDLVKDRA